MVGGGGGDRKSRVELSHHRITGWSPPCAKVRRRRPIQMRQRPTSTNPGRMASAYRSVSVFGTVLDRGPLQKIKSQGYPPQRPDALMTGSPPHMDYDMRSCCYCSSSRRHLDPVRYKLYNLSLLFFVLVFFFHKCTTRVSDYSCADKAR